MMMSIVPVGGPIRRSVSTENSYLGVELGKCSVARLITRQTVKVKAGM